MSTNHTLVSSMMGEKKQTSFTVPDVHCPLKMEVILPCLLSRGGVTCRGTNIDPEGVVNKVYTLCTKYRREGQNEVPNILWNRSAVLLAGLKMFPWG